MRSYLFNSVINVSTGPEEEREMLTGVHVVRDIYCISCQSNVGWKYVRPHTLPRLPPSLARTAAQMFVRAFCVLRAGDGVRGESEVQGGSVHHREGPHAEGQLLGPRCPRPIRARRGGGLRPTCATTAGQAVKWRTAAKVLSLGRAQAVGGGFSARRGREGRPRGSSIVYNRS